MEGNTNTIPALNQDPQLRAQGQPKYYLASLSVKTTRGPEFIDITDSIQELIDKTGIKEGNVLIYSKHTTAAVVVQENEPLLISDMLDRLEKIASPADDYEHNDFDIRTVNMCDDECANGHAHCQHLFIGATEHVPVTEGKLAVGRWQRVFLLELDRPRPRTVDVQICGI